MFDSGITSNHTGTVPDSDLSQSDNPPDYLPLILHDVRMIRARPARASRFHFEGLEVSVYPSRGVRHAGYVMLGT